MLKFIIVTMITFYSVASANAADTSVRVGAGSDISFVGTAFGLGVRFAFPGFEAGPDLYMASTEETSSNGFNNYTEKTDVLVIGVRADKLYGYDANTPSMYFVAGAGVAAVSVDWTESSPTDTSLGTPLPGGGSTQNASGTSAGLLLNLGVGYNIGTDMDVRAEIPTIMVLGDYGGAASVIPLFNLSLGYHF